MLAPDSRDRARERSCHVSTSVVTPVVSGRYRHRRSANRSLIRAPTGSVCRAAASTSSCVRIRAQSHWRRPARSTSTTPSAPAASSRPAARRAATARSPAARSPASSRTSSASTRPIAAAIAATGPPPAGSSRITTRCDGPERRMRDVSASADAASSGIDPAFGSLSTGSCPAAGSTGGAPTTTTVPSHTAPAARTVRLSSDRPATVRAVLSTPPIRDARPPDKMIAPSRAREPATGAGRPGVEAESWPLPGVTPRVSTILSGRPPWR